MIERAGSPSAEGPNRASASRQASGPTPQLTPIASTPAAVRARTATSGVVPSASTRSSPNVIDAITGTSAARRASSAASRRCSRSKKVSMTRRSTPPSSSPSTCSRNAARMVASSGWRSSRVGGPRGPMLPPTHASRPLTSRASRATCAARRLNLPASSASPYTSSRIRLAPNVRVSMRSAPASRYSRWSAATRSERVVASSSRHARWGIPRENSSVPMPPSASSGAAARRAANRSRGRLMAQAYPVGPPRRNAMARRRRPSVSEPSASSSTWAGAGRPL